MVGQESIIQVISVISGNAPALLAAQRDMFNSQQAFTDLFQPPQLKEQMTMTYKANAKTVAGVQLNQFQTQFGPPAGAQPTPQQAQMQQMMTMMYGPNGMNGYAGVIGNDKMIGAVGTSDAALEQLITAAKAGQDTISKQPHIQAVKQQLPKSRVFEGYFAVDTLATTVASYARMFIGMNANLQLPQNLPPVGWTVGTDGNALRADGFVPAQLVQSMTAALMQLKMQMQGGPGGPGGGPGGPGGPGGL